MLGQCRCSILDFFNVFQSSRNKKSIFFCTVFRKKGLEGSPSAIIVEAPTPLDCLVLNKSLLSPILNSIIPETRFLAYWWNIYNAIQRNNNPKIVCFVSKLNLKNNYRVFLLSRKTISRLLSGLWWETTWWAYVLDVTFDAEIYARTVFNEYFFNFIQIF